MTPIESILPGLFWLVLLAAIVATGVAIARRSASWIFAAAAIVWALSSLAAWSIGYLILALAFILAALGVATFFRWDSVWQMALAAGIGALLWAVVIAWFHEYLWLAWPWLWLLG